VSDSISPRLFPTLDSIESILWPGAALLVFVATAVLVDTMILLAMRWRLLDLPNVISYKAASGTPEEVSQLRALCGDRLAVYSGDDSLTLPMLAVGAVGVVSVASHVAGPQISAMISAFLAGDHPRALALHEQLLPLGRALFSTTNPIPVKAALELCGWPVGAPRLPLLAADEAVKQRLSETLAALRPT
jgi:4-hydroxy-tetrahydrodipicolinate synthase